MQFVKPSSAIYKFYLNLYFIPICRNNFEIKRVLFSDKIILNIILSAVHEISNIYELLYEKYYINKNLRFL